MSDEPKDSVAQAVPMAIDTSEESFSVDAQPEPVEGKTESDASAEEEKGTEEEKEEAGAEEEKEEKTEDTSDSDKDKKGKDGEKEGDKKDTADKGKEKAEPEAEVETGDEKLPKGVQKRLAKMRRKQGDAEREAIALRQELEATKAELEAHTKVDIGEKPTRPKPDDFEDEDKYDDALAEFYEKLSEFNAKKVLAEQERTKRLTSKEAAEKDREKILKERHAEIQRGLREVKDKYDDFDDVMKAVVVPDDLLEVFEKLPNIGDVAYYLGKHADVLDDVSNMTLVDATIRLMEVSTSLKPKKTTKAPPPIKPVSGTGGGIKTLDKVPFAEYKKIREKQMKEAAGR